MPHGEACPQAKITAEQARLIYLGRHRDGRQLTELARAYGISRGTVSHICAGRVWRQATAELRAELASEAEPS